MTALKPVESRNVRAVASETYPSNLVCAHPSCSNPVDLRPDGTPTVHHCFPASMVKSRSYFVSINDQAPVPHAVGLCGSGTTGHHGDVEEHRAWIKLEDGVWVWYERDGEDWSLVGPLNPQPGSREGKTKGKRTGGGKRGKARSKTTVSLSVPKDEQENGAEVLRTLIDQAREKYVPIMGWDDDVPDYYVVVAVLVKDAQS